MNRISAGQLTCILLLSNAFMLMCISEPVGLESMLGTAVSFAVQFLICIFLLMLYKKGFSFSALCQQKHYIIPCLYILYFIVRGGYSFVLIWNGAEQISLPFSEALVTAVLIGIVCLYTASLGLRAFARASSVVFGLLVLSVVILLIGAWQRIDLTQLSLTREITVTGSALHQFSLADTLPVFFVLLSFSDISSRKLKNTLFLPASLILWEIVLFLCITVLGNLLSSAKYPFFLLTSVSQPLDTQRADAFYLITFVLLCVIRLTLFTVLSAHLMGMLFPKLRLRSIIALLLMIGAGAALGAIGFSGSLFCIAAIVLFAGAVPAYFYFRQNKNSHTGKETGA